MATTVAILQLVEQGKLTLEDDVDMLKDAKLQEGKPERQIKIKDLLTHTSGLTYGFWEVGDTPDASLAGKYRNAGLDVPHAITPYLKAPDQDPPTTLKEFVDRLMDLKPLFTSPGKVFRYSTATDVLGAIVEHVSGLSLGDYFRKNIFDPAGMSQDTAFYISETQLSKLAAMKMVTFKSPELVSWTPKPEDLICVDPAVLPILDERGGLSGLGEDTCYWRRDVAKTCSSGGGGLVSTVDDVVKFGSALLSSKLISDETSTMLRTDYLGANNIAKTGLVEKYPGFGLGFWTTDNQGGGPSPEFAAKLGKFTGGWHGAAGTGLITDPENNIVIVIAAQLLGHFFVHPAFDDDIIKDIYDALDAVNLLSSSSG